MTADEERHGAFGPAPDEPASDPPMAMAARGPGTGLPARVAAVVAVAAFGVGGFVAIKAATSHAHTANVFAGRGGPGFAGSPGSGGPGGAVPGGAIPGGGPPPGFGPGPGVGPGSQPAPGPDSE